MLVQNWSFYPDFISLYMKSMFTDFFNVSPIDDYKKSHFPRDSV